MTKAAPEVCMKVKSVAGGFDVAVADLRVEDGKLVVLGTLDGMDCRTELAADDVLRLARLALRPDVIRAVLRELRARLGARKGAR